MEANKVIKARRIELGLSEGDVSSAAGLSWNEYFDLELHESEAFEVVTLGALRAVCRRLEIDLLDLVGVTCAACKSGGSGSDDLGQPRHKLIATRRREHGISFSDLADRLGFYQSAVVDLEHKEDFLERWPIDLIRHLAQELNLPLQALLAYQCRTCGR